MSQQTLSGMQVSNTDRPYYPVVSPVNRSVAPDSKKARQMTATSGRKCSEWCRSSGPLGLLERMLLASSIWRSMMCLLTWSVRVTPAGRSYFRLRASVPPTFETECSLWPTPHANCHTGAGEHGSGGPNLQMVVRELMYPTPCAQDAKNSTPPPSQRDRDTVPGALIRRMFYTPTSVSGNQNGRLDEWGGSHNPYRGGGQCHPQYLNPEFVEWLMGFPPGWTDCEPSETP